VADAIAADPSAVVECTAQQLADQVGVGRASVIRTAQTLGYEGYPQLRVALARDVTFAPQDQSPANDGTAMGSLRAALDDFGHNLPRVTAALTEEDLVGFVSALDEADRVVISANGLSAPLGLDAVMRLGAVGRPAEYMPDPMAQQIAARQLSPDSVCLLISGSGVNRTTLAVANAARQSGAKLLVLTSFSNTPLVGMADTVLIVPPVTDSFRDELLHTSRAALTLLVEQLVALLVERRGDRASQAHAAVLAVLGQSLDD
jgi:DNA-binding MurR/RpiR family transcriptional regulator